MMEADHVVSDHVIKEMSGNQPPPKRDKFEKAKRKLKDAYHRNVRRRISKTAADWSRDKFNQSRSVKSKSSSCGTDNPGFHFSTPEAKPIPIFAQTDASCLSRERICETGPLEETELVKTGSDDSPFDRQQPTRRNVRLARSRPSMRRYRAAVHLPSENKENESLIIQANESKDILNTGKNKSLLKRGASDQALLRLNDRAYLSNNASTTCSPSEAPPGRVLVNSNREFNRPSHSGEDSEDSQFVGLSSDNVDGECTLDLVSQCVKFRKSVSDSKLLVCKNVEAKVDCNLKEIRDGKRKRSESSRIDFVKRNRELVSRVENVKMIRSFTKAKSKSEVTSDDKDEKKSKLGFRRSSTQKTKDSAEKTDSKWDALARGTPIRTSQRGERRSSQESTKSSKSPSDSPPQTPSRTASLRSRVLPDTPRLQRFGLRSSKKDESKEAPSKVSDASSRNLKKPDNPTPKRTTAKLRVPEQTCGFTVKKPPISPATKSPDQPHEVQTLSPSEPSTPCEGTSVRMYLGQAVRIRNRSTNRQTSPRPNSCNSNTLEEAGQGSEGMIEKRHSSGVEFRVDLSSPVTRTQSTSVYESKLRADAQSKIESARSSGDFSRGDSGLDSDLSPSGTSDVTNDSTGSPPRTNRGELTPTNQASWAQSLDNSQVFKHSNQEETRDTRKTSIPGSRLLRTGSMRIRTQEPVGELKRTSSFNNGLAKPNVRIPDPASDAKRKLTSPNRLVSLSKRSKEEAKGVQDAPSSPVRHGKLSKLPRTPSLDRMTRTESNSNLKRTTSIEIREKSENALAKPTGKVQRSASMDGGKATGSKVSVTPKTQERQKSSTTSPGDSEGVKSMKPIAKTKSFLPSKSKSDSSNTTSTPGDAKTLTSPRSSVTSPRPSVTSPRPSVTSPRPSVTSPRPSVTSPRSNMPKTSNSAPPTVRKTSLPTSLLTSTKPKATSVTPKSSALSVSQTIRTSKDSLFAQDTNTPEKSNSPKSPTVTVKPSVAHTPKSPRKPKEEKPPDVRPKALMSPDMHSVITDLEAVIAETEAVVNESLKKSTMDKSRNVSVDHLESNITTFRQRASPKSFGLALGTLDSSGQSVHKSDTPTSNTSASDLGDDQRVRLSSESDEVFAAPSVNWHYRNHKKRTSPGRLVSDSGLLHFEMEQEEPLPEVESEEDSSGDECVSCTVKASAPQPLQFSQNAESYESIFTTVSADGAWRHEDSDSPMRTPTPEMLAPRESVTEISVSGAWKRTDEPRPPRGSCSIDAPTVVEAVSRHADFYESEYDNTLVRRALAMHGNAPYIDRHDGTMAYRADRYREDSPRDGGGEGLMYDGGMREANQYILSSDAHPSVELLSARPSRPSLRPASSRPEPESPAHLRSLSDDGKPNGFREPEPKRRSTVASLFRSKSLRNSGAPRESDSTSTSDDNRETKRRNFIRKVLGSKRRKDKKEDDVTPRTSSPANDEEDENDVTLTEEVNVETRKVSKHQSESFIEEEDGLIRLKFGDEGSYTNFALAEPEEADEVTALPVISPRTMSPVEDSEGEERVRKFSDGVSVGIAGLNMPERAKSPPSFNSCDLSFPYGGPRLTRSHNEISPGARVKLSRTDSFRVGKKPDDSPGEFHRGAIYRGSGTMKKMVALIKPMGKDSSKGLDLNYMKSTVERRQNKRLSRDSVDGCHSDSNAGCYSDSGLGNESGRDTENRQEGMQDIVDLSRKADIESLKTLLSNVPVRMRNRDARLGDRPKSDNFDSTTVTGNNTLDSGTGSLCLRDSVRKKLARPMSYGGQSMSSDGQSRPVSQISLSSDASSQETIARVSRSRTFSAPRPIKLRKKRTPDLRRSHTVRNSTSAPDLVALLRNPGKHAASGSTSTDASSMYYSNLQLADTDEIGYKYDTMSLGSCASSQSNMDLFNEEVVMRAEAVWDHVTMDLDELPFRAGQVINVTDMMDRDWWWGALNDRQGWFPAQFVRPLVNQSPYLESPDDTLKRRPSYDVQKDQTATSRDQARSNVVKEIINVENDYVKNLEYVIEGYKKHAEKRPELFSNEQIGIVFGNIEEILLFSRQFLRRIEENIDQDYPHKSCIGRCFLDMKEGFEIYSAYCNNHPLAVAELQKLRHMPQYCQFFEACRLLQDKSMLPLEGFLLTPVQKICKYPLQLAELLKYTLKDSEDSDMSLDYTDITNAVSCMKEIAQLINENKRLVESVEKIAIWQTSIQNWEGPDVLDESTVLIQTGELNKTSLNSGWPRDRIFFLFDHQLIYCKKDLLRKDLLTYKGRIHTDHCDIVPVSDGRDYGRLRAVFRYSSRSSSFETSINALIDNLFNVTVRYAWKMIDRRKNKCYLLMARSQTDKDRWLRALEEERTKVLSGFDEKAVSQAKKLAAQALKTKMEEEQKVNATVKARVARSASIRRQPSSQRHPSIAVPATSGTSLKPTVPNTSIKSSDSKKHKNWSFFGARKVHR